jgi:hypothetical protein
MIFLLGETLRIGDLEYAYVQLECIYHPERGNASWTWIEPSTNRSREDLPQCSRKCKVDPLNRSDLKRNWTQLVSIRTLKKLFLYPFKRY